MRGKSYGQYFVGKITDSFPKYKVEKFIHKFK